MLARLLSLALIAAAPAAAEPVPGAAVLTPDAEARWVPFTPTGGGQIAFVAEVDGRAVTAILDTGVSHSVLGRGSAAYAPTRVRDGGTAQAVGGAVAIGRMPVRRITFGGLVRDGGEVVVADLPVAAGGGAAIDLLVGRDLLADHALDIDYRARRFRLLASGRLPFAGAVAPLTISARQVYETSMALGGRTLSPVIVDTGDGGAITVTEAGWRASGITAPITSALAYGLAGAVTTGLAVVPAVALGEANTGATEVRIEPPSGLSQAIGVAGRIGSGFLQSYRVLLDPGAGRMVLARYPDAAAEPRRSTSGLLVGLGHDRLRVLHVMRGSPAQATGWRAGEEVCAVDGEAIGADYRTRPIAGWTAETPGRTVKLRLCDGEARALTLQRFY